MSRLDASHPRALAWRDPLAALVLASLVATTVSRGVAFRPADVHDQPPAIIPVRSASGARDPLDALRMDALMGNDTASVELVRQLIDRYEGAGEQDDLHEAFHWMARDWDQPGFMNAGVVQRAMLHHCRHPVLRWHWLCVPGE